MVHGRRAQIDIVNINQRHILPARRRNNGSEVIELIVQLNRIAGNQRRRTSNIDIASQRAITIVCYSAACFDRCVASDINVSQHDCICVLDIER